MAQVIIYRQDNGRPAVVMPTAEALASHAIQEIAVKDVPFGKPFAIVDAADLPDALHETWVVDDDDLTDGIGGESHEFD
jgi:hypothetical protein